ncbi:MAG TPA: P-loop NTPase, partial [Alphaproteobacteria bacterium]|nr:P-loop NTPase [Alphaproteobacteria bacterium]
MSFVQKEQVLEKLKEVLDPALGRVGGVSLTDGKVYVTIETDPEKGAALEPMRQAVEKSLSAMPGVREVHAILTAERSPPPKLTVKQGAAPAKPGGGALGGHKISSRPVAPNVKHMIAVASGKGGVGKSTVAANLAAAFVMLGKKTGLLDADIYGASQPVMMGLREKPQSDKNDM